MCSNYSMLLIKETLMSTYLGEITPPPGFSLLTWEVGGGGPARWEQEKRKGGWTHKKHNQKTNSTSEKGERLPKPEEHASHRSQGTVISWTPFLLGFALNSFSL